MEFEEFKKGRKIQFSVDSRRFKILKMRETPALTDEIFSIIRDRQEVTVIASEGTSLQACSEEKYFRLITFDPSLPFDLTGFLFYISRILAQAKIPLFVASAYSTDHLLIRENLLNRVVKAFEENGISRSP